MRQNKSKLERSPYCRIENFLTERENQRLLEVIYKKKPCFAPSETTTGEPNYRKSLVFFIPMTDTDLLELIRSCMPVATQAAAAIKADASSAHNIDRRSCRRLASTAAPSG